MSAKRYRMALEAILIVSPFDGSTMRRIACAALDIEPLVIPAPPVAEPATGDGRRDGVGEGVDRAGAATADEPDAAPQTATPPAAEVGAPPRAVKAAAPKPRTAAPVAEITGRNTRERLVALLTEKPRTRRELAEALGVTASRVEQLIRGLRDKGQIEVVGGKRQNAANPEIWGLVTQQDAKVAQIAGRGSTGRGAPNVAQIRTYVLECIRQGAGLVDEAEIAAQLELDREHVALATGDLLAGRLVVLQPDGTYVAAEQARAA